MIPSPNYQSRDNARVRLVVLHTAEGARDVVSLGNYLSNPAVEASYHVAFDDNRMEQYVNYNVAAWAVLSANNISDNGCCCGFAAWSRDEWLNNHKIMLELAAQWVASRCIARKLPIRHLSLSEVAACAVDPNHPGGVIGHWDWTRGAQDGNHTDPGAQFPWDWVINRAQQIAGGPIQRGSIDDMGVFNREISGTGRIIWDCPVGSAAADQRDAWLSASVLDATGPVWVRVFAQSDAGGINSWRWDTTALTQDVNNNYKRPWTQLKDKTTKLIISWDVTASAGGVLCLETKPKG